MQEPKSKLVSKLLKLSPEEWTEAKRLIKSGATQADDKAQKIFQYCWKYRKTPNNEEDRLKRDFALSNKVLLKKFFPNQRPKQLTDTLYKISFVIDKMWLSKAIQENEVLKLQLKTKIYRDKNLSGLFIKEWNQAIKKLESKDCKGSFYYEGLTSLYHQKWHHPEQDNFNPKAPDLLSAEKNLDHYYILKKVQYACEKASMSLAFSTDEELFSEHLAEQLKLLYKESPIFEIYHLLLTLLEKKGDDTTYLEVKELFLKNIHQISLFDKRNVSGKLINYNNYLHKIGESDSLKECLFWYKIGDREDVLVHNERMTDISFVNIVITASKLEEFDWSERFIKKNKDFLADGIKEDAVRLSFAYIEFHKQNLEGAIELLDERVFLDPKYSLRGRSLVLRILLKQYQKAPEKSIDEILLRRIDSFQKHLRTEKISILKPISYQNFVRFINKFLLLIEDPNIDLSALNKLYLELKATKPVHLKTWIISEIEELKKLLNL